jgi:DNA invertase Pin-like site-specific DNA recombinase
MKAWTAVYVRVSTAEQRVDSQELELRRYCGQRGWDDTKFYTDRISGASCSRPELDSMMKDVRSGQVSRVVCYKLDRLGRSLTHLALMLDELNRLKVPLIASSQGIDTSDDNPAGRLQLGVLMAVAEFERGIIRERVKAGVAAAKARGVKLGRPPRLKARAPEVMALKKQGLGIRAISRSLGMPVSSVHSLVEWAERGWASVRQSSKQEAHV